MGLIRIRLTGAFCRTGRNNARRELIFVRWFRFLNSPNHFRGMKNWAFSSASFMVGALNTELMMADSGYAFSHCFRLFVATVRVYGPKTLCGAFREGLIATQ